MREMWCEMKFSQLYPELLVSDDGEIFLYGVRRLEPYPFGKGYMAVYFNRKKTSVHRAVASALCPGYLPGLHVNHKNGVKTDNRPDNLEWVTVSENNRHAFRIGLKRNAGETHSRAKLSDVDVESIHRMRADGLLQREIAEAYGCTQVHIGRILSGKIRAKWRIVPAKEGK